MALEVRWFDGFEHYGLDENNLRDGTGAWSGGGASELMPNLTAAQARTGVRSVVFPVFEGLRRVLGGSYTVVNVGCAWYMENLPLTPVSSAPYGPFMLTGFFNGYMRTHISIQVTQAGRIAVIAGGLEVINQNGVQIGISTLAMAPGTFNHVETSVHIHDTTGWVVVRVNGREFLSLTNIDTNRANTTPGTDATVSIIGFGNFVPAGLSFFGDMYLDDVFAATDEGAGAATFLGMQGVYYLPPVADAAPQDWDRTTGTESWALVNETTPDDDTNYIFTDTAGDECRLVVDDLPANVLSVASVAVVSRSRKTDTGTCDVSLGVFSGAVLDYAASEPLTTDYGYIFASWDTNVDGGGAWSPVALPAIEIKRIA